MDSGLVRREVLSCIRWTVKVAGCTLVLEIFAFRVPDVAVGLEVVGVGGPARIFLCPAVVGRLDM